MDLNTIIPHYYEMKQELDNLDKTCKAENADIKREMERRKITDFSIGDLTAKYIVKKRETMDEDALIKLLKSHNYFECIQTKEYVDMDILESMLYKNKIDTDTVVEMDKCKNVKETIELRVTKKKGGNK